jgi:hypothetical protein
MRSDIPFFEPFKIKFFQIILYHSGRLEFGIAELVVEIAKPLFAQEMIDPLASFAAKIERLTLLGSFCDHHLFIKFEMTMGAYDLRQRASFG